jgi:hypothetical protein
MKRNWTTEELVECWTLVPNELAILDYKTGPTGPSSPLTVAPASSLPCPVLQQ